MRIAGIAGFGRDDVTDVLRPEGFMVNIGSLILSTLAVNILSLALPVMTLQVYDRILPNPGSGTLPVLIAGVCVAIILEAALRLSRAYVLSWSGAVYEHKLSCAAMKRIMDSDISILGAAGVGENLHRMTAISKLKDFYNGYSLTVMSDLVFVPLFLFLIIYIAGPLAVVPAAILMAFTLVSLAQGQNLRSALSARDESDDTRYNFLIEGLEGVHTLKAFALENSFSRRYEALEEKSSLANYRVTEAMAATFNAGALFSHIMVAAVIAVGAILVLGGTITTGGLIATVLLSGRLMQPVQRALGLWVRYQDYRLARQKAETLFDIPLHAAVAAEDENTTREGSLILENLSFRLGGENGRWILEDINLVLKRGESILLSADSDESKTVLLELIAGIYPVTRGRIMVDNRNILRYTPEDLIRHVGYIQSQGIIFRGTIRDNMTCFGQIPEAQAQEIAALLDVNRDVALLPTGFDTFLNGNGTDNIPPGLKQRIAMVRVLAARPRLILYDNADQGLDRDGYNLIYSLMARLRGQATMIMISDDYNVRSLADRFYSLENGRLTETQGLFSTGHIQPYRELRL